MDNQILLEQGKTPFENNDLRSSNGIMLLYRYRIIMVIMELLQKILLKTVPKGVKIFFSGAISQHQNARTEHSIKSIMYMSCTFMGNTSLNWADTGVDDILL